MKTIDNWASKKLNCSNCGTSESVKWTNNDNVLCNKCIIEDVLENNQMSMFPIEAELTANALNQEVKYISVN